MGQSVTRSRQWELRLQRGVTVPWENKPCANSKGHNASHECYFLHSQRASRGSFVPEIPRSSTEEPNCPSIQNLFIFFKTCARYMRGIVLESRPWNPKWVWHNPSPGEADPLVGLMLSTLTCGLQCRGPFQRELLAVGAKQKNHHRSAGVKA